MALSTTSDLASLWALEFCSAVGRPFLRWSRKARSAETSSGVVTMYTKISCLYRIAVGFQWNGRVNCSGSREQNNALAAAAYYLCPHPRRSSGIGEESKFLVDAFGELKGLASSPGKIMFMSNLSLSRHPQSRELRECLDVCAPRMSLNQQGKPRKARERRYVVFEVGSEVLRHGVETGQAEVWLSARTLQDFPTIRVLALTARIDSLHIHSHASSYTRPIAERRLGGIRAHEQAARRHVAWDARYPRSARAARARARAPPTVVIHMSYPRAAADAARFSHDLNTTRTSARTHPTPSRSRARVCLRTTQRNHCSSNSQNGRAVSFAWAVALRIRPLLAPPKSTTDGTVRGLESERRRAHDFFLSFVGECPRAAPFLHRKTTAPRGAGRSREGARHDRLWRLWSRKVGACERRHCARTDGGSPALYRAPMDNYWHRANGAGARDTSKNIYLPRRPSAALAARNCTRALDATFDAASRERVRVRHHPRWRIELDPARE
ncbi:hypothetical protein C8R45DRAFT_1186888 [Mycena sanguinolenta]|nr:hypothetical protein C8R45DRAFT_1186888 [Mycena sanguinolenta]